MNIRHAAALSLMTWLLMVPPHVPNSGEVNKSAPLSEWVTRRRFPHNQGCEAAKERLQKAGQAHEAELDTMGRRGPHNPEFHCFLCQAQCVSVDDPRLKAK
jgi:hypothetical protein